MRSPRLLSNVLIQDVPAKLGKPTNWQNKIDPPSTWRCDSFMPREQYFVVNILVEGGWSLRRGSWLPFYHGTKYRLWGVKKTSNLHTLVGVSLRLSHITLNSMRAHFHVPVKSVKISRWEKVGPPSTWKCALYITRKIESLADMILGASWSLRRGSWSSLFSRI